MAAKLKIEKRVDEIKQIFSSETTGSKGRTAGHMFGREPSNDYFIKI
jgi:hypothetical protein